LNRHLKRNTIYDGDRLYDDLDRPGAVLARKQFPKNSMETYVKSFLVVHKDNPESI